MGVTDRYVITQNDTDTYVFLIHRCARHKQRETDTHTHTHRERERERERLIERERGIVFGSCA